MTREEREQAIAIIRKEYLCVDRDCDIERSCGKCDLMMPSKEPILQAYKMAMYALEQEPKTGHWITQWNAAHQKEYYYCSECREEFSYDGETGIKMNDYDYCPNCGAKMQEVER